MLHFTGYTIPLLDAAVFALANLLNYKAKMIAISGHFVFAGRVGGAEQMFYNLLRGFWSNNVPVELLCSEKTVFDPIFMSQLAAANTPIVINNSVQRRFISEQISVLALELHSDAILFPNYFTPPFTPRRLGRAVTVIHDFLHAERWSVMSRKRREFQKMAYWLTYLRADAVIVPSDFVRVRAYELYGSLAHTKTVTIPNPISWQRFADSSGDVPFEGRPYILTVAAHYPHKNLPILIKAFARLRQQFPDLLLVISGQLSTNLLGVPQRTNEVVKLIAELNLESAAIATGYLDDVRLSNLYRHATLFAFPSLFEGFGMPAVEALGLGLPTLTTRMTSLPEVTMGFAHYVNDPTSVDEWVDNLAHLLRNPSACRPQQSIVSKLRERYSPSRIAAMYERTLLG